MQSSGCSARGKLATSVHAKCVATQRTDLKNATLHQADSQIILLNSSNTCESMRSCDFTRPNSTLVHVTAPRHGQTSARTRCLPCPNCPGTCGAGCLPFLLRAPATPPRPVGSTLGEGIAGLKDLWSHVLLKDGEQALPVEKAERTACVLTEPWPWLALTGLRAKRYYLCLVLSHDVFDGRLSLKTQSAPVVVVGDTATVVDMPDNEEERVPRDRSIQLLPTNIRDLT